MNTLIILIISISHIIALIITVLIAIFIARHNLKQLVKDNSDFNSDSFVNLDRYTHMDFPYRSKIDDKTIKILNSSNYRARGSVRISNSLISTDKDIAFMKLNTYIQTEVQNESKNN